MKLVIHLLISTLAIYLLAKFLPGVHLQGASAPLIVAVVLGFINTVLKPVLKLLTFPLSFLTLGLFSVILNALLVILADKLIPGFALDGFLTALIFGVIMSIVSSIIKMLD